MTVFYCPYCWREVPRADDVCQHCGVVLREESEDYVAKLVAALKHPDYLTRSRAAYVLGQIASVRALAPLIATLHGDHDPYVRAEAASALGAIEAPETEAVLSAVVANLRQSVIVRRAAQAALARRRQRKEHGDG